MKNILLFAGVLSLAFACTSVKTTPPEDAAAEVYMRYAQEAREAGNLNLAMDIYQKLLAKDAQTPLTPDQKIVLEYEIAFVNFKLENYTQCRTESMAILEQFKDQDKAAYFPPWVKVLTQKLLDNPKVTPGAKVNPEA